MQDKISELTEHLSIAQSLQHRSSVQVMELQRTECEYVSSVQQAHTALHILSRQVPFLLSAPCSLRVGRRQGISLLASLASCLWCIAICLLCIAMCVLCDSACSDIQA